MERILEIELTPREKERVEKLRKRHNTTGFLYMEEVTLLTPDGENSVWIIWSPTKIEDCDPEEKVEIWNITDIPE